jgi:hypothetical protein
LTYVKPENVPGAGYDATLSLTITNTGTTAARNVYGGLLPEGPHLEAQGYGHASFTDQVVGNLAPTLYSGLRAHVRVRADGMNKVRYRCWADEVPLTEGAFEFEVTKREPWSDYSEQRCPPTVHPLYTQSLEFATVRVGTVLPKTAYLQGFRTSANPCKCHP